MPSPHRQTVRTLTRITPALICIVLLSVLGLLSERAVSGQQEGSSQNVRLATGVFNFTESWTLSRAPDGSLEVEGKRDYQSPSDEAHSNKFTVHLSSDFRTLSLREFRKLRWKPDSGTPGLRVSPKQALLHIWCRPQQKYPT
jgi:hypothetical protein